MYEFSGRWCNRGPPLWWRRNTQPVSTIRSTGFVSGGGQRCLALPDLPHRCVHIGEVPDLGELAVFDAIKSELRNSHPTTGRLNSLEGPPVGTGDSEVHRDIVAVDNDMPCLPMPVRKCGDQRVNCAVTAAGSSIGTSLTLRVDV
jgi:hypothetical protein